MSKIDDLLKRLRGIIGLQYRPEDAKAITYTADALEAAKKVMQEIKTIGDEKADWTSVEASLADDWLNQYDID